MEKSIDTFSGIFNSKHIKQGITVREKRSRNFVGIVVENFRGVSIRTPSDQLLGLENDINVLMTKFQSSYLFYLL